jgi:hypothetical protein
MGFGTSERRLNLNGSHPNLGLEMRCPMRDPQKSIPFENSSRGRDIHSVRSDAEMLRKSRIEVESGHYYCDSRSGGMKALGWFR